MDTPYEKTRASTFRTSTPSKRADDAALTQESRARAAPHPLHEQSPPSATAPWARCSASNPTQRSRVASSPTVTVAYTRTRLRTRTHRHTRRRTSIARTDTSRARRPRQNIPSSSFSLSRVVYRSTRRRRAQASQNDHVVLGMRTDALERSNAIASRATHARRRWARRR
jgi:hypothetical protein